jgi:hypothetical protein
MTDSEKLLADLFIQRIPHEHINTIPYFGNILNEEDRTTYGEDVYNEMIELMVYSKTGAIRKYLLNNDYLTPIDKALPTDKISEKGKAAQKKGGIAKYEEWLIEEEERIRIEKNKKEFKDTWQYWVLVGLSVIAIITPILICNKQEQDNKSIQNTLPLQEQLTPTTSLADSLKSDTTSFQKK